MSSSNKSDEEADVSVGLADIGAPKEMADDSTSQSASWRELLEISSNRSRKIRGSNYVQLATVDPQTQTPRCRCVVFRGFETLLDRDHACASYLKEQSCLLRMCTDARSQKVHETAGGAEMVWWFPKTTEQYRIRGELLLIGDSKTGKGMYDQDAPLQVARKQLWGNLSDAARESFFDLPVPGQPLTTTNTTPPPVGGRDDDGKVLPPPDNFLLMLLRPSHVDYLRLKNQYRQIDQQQEDGSWSSTSVNP